MKLMDGVQGKKGVTLNGQLVDLLSILDEPISDAEKDQKIERYIALLKNLDARMKEASAKGPMARYDFAISIATQTIPGIDDETKLKLKTVIMNSVRDLSVCDRELMEERLKASGLDPALYSGLIRHLGKINFTAKAGILTLTPQKVRQYYDHLFNPENRYDRVTIDNAGKYSGFVGVDGKTFTPDNLDKIVAFCQRHNMEAKINALVFYADYPKLYDAYLSSRVQRGEITEEQKAQLIKKSLMDYANEISTRYNGKVQAVDMFNELVYDNAMLEEREYFQEDPTYHVRTKGWQKYLGLEDLCEMALLVRNNMPEVTFTYNDMHWVDPKKRPEIIRVIKEIQKIEERYRKEGKLFPGDKGLIDTVGVEAHLFTTDNLDEIERIFDDISRETGLPQEITELDVARTGEDPLSYSEKRKQGLILEKLHKIAQRPDVVGVTTWSQNDDLSFMNVKCGKKVYASLLDSDFSEKEISVSRDIEPQSYNFHTHTALCGHADGQIEQYVEKGIESGFEVLGFSDHSPSPTGKNDPHSRMSMEQFKTVYIPQLQALREQYKDQIDIKIGLEEEYYGDDAEQNPNIQQYRELTTPHLDYLILGQHFALARDELGVTIQPFRNSDHKSARYPLDYAYTVVEAIRSGKYAYVAHPDIFMQNRDTIMQEEREIYDENVRIATEMICEEAAKCGIPLEVNLGAIEAVKHGVKRKMEDGTYPYPVPYFWQVAQAKGCKAVMGFDSHSPSQLLDRKLEIEVKEYLKNYGIDIEFIERYMPRGIGSEGQMKISKEELREGLEGVLTDSRAVDETSREMNSQMARDEQTQTKDKND